MSIITLRTKINDKLNTLTGTWKPLVEVFNYHTLENTWYPFVTFEPASLVWEFEDTCNNMRTYTFDVFLYQEITWNGRQEALNILLNAFKQIIDEFDKDYTLWGIAEWWVNAVSGDFWQLVSADWKILFANLKIICKLLTNIT